MNSVFFEVSCRARSGAFAPELARHAARTAQMITHTERQTRNLCHGSSGWAQSPRGAGASKLSTRWMERRFTARGPSLTALHH